MEDTNLIHTHRNTIKKRLYGKTSTLLVVVGPCSIYNEEETLAYEKRLQKLQVELGDSILLVMRTFVEKSRTSHAWRGFIYQPDLLQPENIQEGIKQSRSLFKKLKTPLAMEFIDPNIYPYVEDLISWGFIGARTSTSTTHRVLASSSDIPFGFKNSLDGDVLSAISSCVVAKHSHCILSQGKQSHTKGNPYTHVVLRGGKNGVNYKQHDLDSTEALAKDEGVTTPILIDCSHGNCPNKPDDQKAAFLSALESYMENSKQVLGVMLESNINKGSEKKYKRQGVSFTDPCLSFEETRELLLFAKKEITQYHMEGLNQPTSCV